MKRFILAMMYLPILLIGCSQAEVADNSTKEPIRRGPAPQYIEFAAAPEQKEYSSGEPVRLKVSIRNVWEDNIQIVNTPKVLIGPLMVPTDQYEAIPLPSFNNRMLKPKEVITEEVVWNGKTAPGWYLTELADIDLHQGTRLGGGGGRFFVQYPPGQTLVKTIEFGGKVDLPSDPGVASMTIKRIEFTEKHTKVFFDIQTDQMAPMGFQMALVRSNGITDPGPALGGEQSENINGVITGSAAFGPTTTDVKQVSVQITEWSVVHTGKGVETLKGPWKWDIPIN